MAIKENKDKEKISTLLEDLTSLESYARDLFSFLPIPVCLVSSIEIILEVNPAFERITGYKVEEIIGKPMEDIFSKEELKELTKETLKDSLIKEKEAQMREAANKLEFELAAILRDEIRELKSKLNKRKSSPLCRKEMIMS